MSDALYRIKNENGLYSTGGSTPSFTKRGKVWTNIGHVKNHLHGLDRNGRKQYKDCTLITYVITETVLEEKPVMELVVDLMEQVQEKERARQSERTRLAKEQELKQLRALLQKYPNEVK